MFLAGWILALFVKAGLADLAPAPAVSSVRTPRPVITAWAGGRVLLPCYYNYTGRLEALTVVWTKSHLDFHSVIWTRRLDTDEPGLNYKRQQRYRKAPDWHVPFRAGFAIELVSASLADGGPHVCSVTADGAAEEHVVIQLIVCTRPNKTVANSTELIPPQCSDPGAVTSPRTLDVPLSVLLTMCCLVVFSSLLIGATAIYICYHHRRQRRRDEAGTDAPEVPEKGVTIKGKDHSISHQQPLIFRVGRTNHIEERKEASTQTM